MKNREALIDVIRQHVSVPPGYARTVLEALDRLGYRIVPPRPPLEHLPDRCDHPQPRTYL